MLFALQFLVLPATVWSAAISEQKILNPSIDRSIVEDLPDADQIVASHPSFSQLTTILDAADLAKDSIRNIYQCAWNTWEDSSEDGAETSEENRGSWLDHVMPDMLHSGGHHHPPHHGRPTRTVYELINEGKYTTKAAEFINMDEDMVKLLNDSSANLTLFAPIDAAFGHIHPPDKHKHKYKELIKEIMTYHVSPEFYPAGRVLVTRTIPSALTGEHLGGEAQRLSTQISLRGLTVNNIARIVAIDVFATNGVIHGIDSILPLPSTIVKILSSVPQAFSMLELGLIKTGLLPFLNNIANRTGGTLFAPTDFAFRLLGPKINEFLFSPRGEKYLRALLQYHFVPNYTLYSDTFYKGQEEAALEIGPTGRIPKDLFHVDLPTLLARHELSIDIARYGRFISIKINGFTRVAISDVVAVDGVLHVLDNVIIPPRTPGGPPHFVTEEEESLSLEDFIQRMDPLVENQI